MVRSRMRWRSSSANAPVTCKKKLTCSCSELRISDAQLDNSAWFLLALAENRMAGLLTITENELAIGRFGAD